MRKTFTFLCAALMSMSMFAQDPSWLRSGDEWDEVTQTLTVKSDLGNQAYESRGSILHLVITEGVTEIGAQAFQHCGEIIDVVIPASVTSIGSDAFYDCQNVTDVYCYPDAADLNWNDDYCDDFKSDHATNCHVKSSYLDTYNTNWGNTPSSSSNSGVNVTFVGDLTDPEPAQDGPSVTWEASDIDFFINWDNGWSNHNTETVKDVTITANGGSSNYCQFGYSDYDAFSSFSISDGATLTFSSSLGNLKGIVISGNPSAYRDLGDLDTSTGWAVAGSQLKWTGDAASVVLTCNNPGSINFQDITSIVFTFAAAPATTTTTITWDQADIESLGLADNDVDEFSPSQEIDGITASLTRTDAGQYTYCQIDNSNLWITNSCGYITFTSAVGDISRIVITYDENSYHSLSDLTAGWTEDNQVHTLTWTGTASDEVTLSGSMDIMVSSIEFTVTSGSASSDPVSQGPVTWDFVNDEELASLDLSRYTHYYFEYYSAFYDNHYGETVKDFKGIVATILAEGDGDYATFGPNNNYSIDLENGGTLTFSTTLGQFQSIVINTNNGSGRNSGDWAWDLTEHTLTWAGTPANSVVMDDIFIDEITSIVFTFVSAASADPEPETIPGPSFKWEQRQVNHVDLIADETAPVIKNVITSITQTSNGGNCYFGYWGEKGKLNIGNCGYLTFQSIVGDLRAIVITCSSVTTAENLSTDWTYDGEAGTLTWVGEYASDEVTISGNINIDISEIEFYYTPAPAPRLGETFYDAAYQLYEITGAQTAKVAQQQWLSHTLDIPASVEDGGVTYYITEIDDYAFQDDLELPNVMGGANIGRIGAHAFDGCLRMDEIDIESEVLDEIGEAAFKGCKLMQDIGFYTELPPVLGTNAFDDTRYLNHILVPYGNLSAYQAADGWSAYAAKINTTYSDPQTGEQFFYHNQTTTNIYAVLRTSPKEAKVLPYTAEVNAIYPITRTGTLVIPEEALYIHNMYTITGIGANAYKDSTRFNTVMMPIAVKLIEEGAFRNCTGVEKVYFLWDDPTEVTWADADQGLDFKTAASGNTKIFVPENRLAAYQAWAPAWASCMIGADILDVTATGDPHNNLRHYRTFYDSEVDYLMPPSVWAHAGYVSGDNFILSSVAFDGEILPRGTAVVLESETPTYRLIPVGNDAPLYTGRNDLRGLDEAKAVSVLVDELSITEEQVYVLGRQATIGGDLRVGMGMYQYSGTTLGAHKAYMILPSGVAPAPRFLFQQEEQTTDVENVQSDNMPCTKILRDGQLIIIKDGKEYNAQGFIVK